jgi:hypothetical protein
VQQHVAPDEVRSRRLVFSTRSLSPIEADDRFDGSLGPRIEEVQIPGEVGRVSSKHPNTMGQKGIEIAGVCNSAGPSAPGERHPVFDQSAKGNARIHEGNI